MARVKNIPIVKLSPSNSGHWLNCAGYAQACAHITDDSSSPAAELGTAAHALLETCLLLEVWDASKLDGAIVNSIAADEDMTAAVQLMLDWIADWMKERPGSTLLSEHLVELDLGGYTLTGTADVVLYHPESGALAVPDYKHGAGIWVDAEGNTQVGLYLLGVLSYLRSQSLSVSSAVGVICQPRAAHGGGPLIRHWEPTASDLRALLARATEAVHQARLPNPKRTAGGHCRWCGVAAQCRELAEYNLRTAMVEFEDINKRPVISPADPESLSADGLAYILHHAPMLEGWLRAVEAEATKRLLRHDPLPGYKLVAGRTYRQWSNDAEVLKTLTKAGLDMDTIAPRKLLGPAPITKLVKKDEKLSARLEQLIVKSTPPLHLAPESDGRPALAGTASIDFKPLPKNEDRLA